MKCWARVQTMRDTSPVSGEQTNLEVGNDAGVLVPDDGLGIELAGEIGVDGEALPVAAAEGRAAKGAGIRAQRNVDLSPMSAYTFFHDPYSSSGAAIVRIIVVVISPPLARNSLAM